LHDNDGKDFDSATISSILEDISLNYPGFSIVNCVGYWRGENRTYIDNNFQLIVDVLPSDPHSSAGFFTELKEGLSTQLKQEKIYITKNESRSELLTFSEFFQEIGIEALSLKGEKAEKALAEQVITRIDVIHSRLGYETTLLRRDKEKRKIIWERKLCEITLNSQLDDPFPDDFQLVAADQIDSLSRILGKYDSIAIIGGYEYQFYALKKLTNRPLVEAELKNIHLTDKFQYYSQTGVPISIRAFIEGFTANVFANILVLRDEGFLAEEISVNVGRDGSLQIASSPLGKPLLYVPAIIPHEAVQKEIIKCLGHAVELYELNKLDNIALMQAKAKHRYILNRAIVRKSLREARKNDSGTEP